MVSKLLKIIPAGSMVLGLTTLASYGLGLLRDSVFAQTFGASRALDAYNAAFLLPDLLFNILVASGIAAAFIPIFLDIFNSDRVPQERATPHSENKEKAYEYANSVISGATSLMIFSAIILFIFAKPIALLAAPGFPKEDLVLVAKILRILAISP